MKEKSITFWELVLMNVSALYGIRWIAKSTSDSFGLGLGAIPMWIIFMLIFFVPQALMCAELATAYPTDGGLNDWVKIAFGTKYGFLVSWMHWTALIFWYASFLTFFSINFTYMIGKPELADNKILVLIMSLVVFWALSFASMRGMKFGKYFTSVGALGSVVPTVCLIGMAILAVVVFKKAPSASEYTIATLTPKLNMNSLVAISGITFAYTGAEFTANFASEMKNPQKDYPRAIMIAAGTNLRIICDWFGMYDNADADVRNLCVYRDFGCISNCLQSPGSSSIFCSDRSIWNYFVDIWSGSAVYCATDKDVVWIF